MTDSNKKVLLAYPLSEEDCIEEDLEHLFDKCEPLDGSRPESLAQAITRITMKNAEVAEAMEALQELIVNVDTANLDIE